MWPGAGVVTLLFSQREFGQKRINLRDR